MESQRSFLLIGLALVSFLLWQQWQLDYGQPPVQQPVAEVSSSPVAETASTHDDVPTGETPPQAPSAAAEEQNQLIHVRTDSLDVLIESRGGDIVSAKLVDFPVEQGSDESFQLLNPAPGQLYVAQSGLIGQNGPDAAKSGRPLYQVQTNEYTLQDESLTVPLTWRSATGLTVTKNFIFTSGSHAIRVEYQIDNQTGNEVQLQQYAQLKQTLAGPEGSMFMPTYRGAAYSTTEDRYNKYDFEDIQDENLRKATMGGWVGMLEHYFVSAWIPPQDQQNTLYSRILGGSYAAIGYTGTPVSLAAGESTTLSSTLYAGPKDQDTLAGLANGLDLTVDYGVLWWLSQPLFWLLQFIHGLVGNWGLAIIFITIIVKGAMYPLTKAQYESMAKLRALQPKMQALKDRYGDDRQKMSQAMMEMYRKEKVNPMGGCFPLLLQMPIFLALYWVFLESVELRHADFFLWITDLSVKDPYFVLPILTGASMYLLQKLQPMTMTDPMQQKIMQWMPVMMSIFFLWFPAGLVLYWLVSNIITLIQAKMIYASMEKRGLKAR
ncbi:membrane protein insertase YidC [Bowmanella dokdonensis]|uniref:Membrane protein insertase YidC n=1 Tax=Bowmanella dokdonensis TaxID=751969 RepID=A0A939IR91_9ALTE|nr:membrane protein insertase YidC [Bowmanella dokdonensis]MBN7825869.1 membrane protein insertase YidC [Bowmanella dokdonensis]